LWNNPTNTMKREHKLNGERRIPRQLEVSA
jgi:hypothetical protein